MLSGRIRLKKMSRTEAQTILTEPELWPTDIVRAAAETASAGLSDLPPLAKVAEVDGWFTS